MKIRTLLILAGLLALTALVGWGAANDGAPRVVIPADPGATSHIRFIAFGDGGTGRLDQRRVVSAINDVLEVERGADFVVMLGDNFYDDGVKSARDPQWLYKFENVYRGRYLDALPFYAVLGNHDYGGNSQAQIDYAVLKFGSNRWRMPRATYSKDFGAVGERPLVRMVFLDTNQSGAGIAEQSEFLRREMNRSPLPLWKIAVGHHPVRSYGKHRDTPAMVTGLLPTLIQSEVDVYLAAHDHNLQMICHPGEPPYVVAGGGGNSLYEIKDADESMLFGRQTHGFALFDVSESTLSVSFFDASAQHLATFGRGIREKGNCFRALPASIAPS